MAGFSRKAVTKVKAIVHLERLFQLLGEADL
jgi:hypothetical protein